MINILKLKLFPTYQKEVFIPTGDPQKYNVFFYSENSDLSTVYPKLKIKRQYIREIFVPKSKVPLLNPTPKLLAPYKVLKLIPKLKADMSKNNAFIDCTPFLDLLDSKYTKGSFRRPTILSKITQYLTSNSDPEKKNILLIHVDLSQDISKDIFMRRCWPIIVMAKNGFVGSPFEAIILATTLGDSVKFTSIYNKIQKEPTYQRIYAYFKSMKKGKEIEKEEDIEPADESNIDKEIEKADDEELDQTMESIFEFFIGENKMKSINNFITEKKEKKETEELKVDNRAINMMATLVMNKANEIYVKSKGEIVEFYIAVDKHAILTMDGNNTTMLISDLAISLFKKHPEYVMIGVAGPGQVDDITELFDGSDPKNWRNEFIIVSVYLPPDKEVEILLQMILKNGELGPIMPVKFP